MSATKLSPSTIGLLREVRQARMRFERAVLKIGPRHGATLARLAASIDPNRAARLLTGHP